MPKTIDVTSEKNRREAVEFTDNLRRAIMNRAQQVVIEDTGISEDGSREINFRFNGLKRGETPESRAALDKAKKLAEQAQAAADKAKAEAEAIESQVAGSQVTESTAPTKGKSVAKASDK